VRTFRFDKLVRDKIPTDMKDNGNIVSMQKLSGYDYLAALQAKFLEEAKEIDLHDREEALKELADLQEVLDCMVSALDSNAKEIAQLQAIKNGKAGSFKDGVYIETATVADDSPWINYYTGNPDRYPEVTK
jgi:predicted house-cleaning noncanonical NTP pyrophosphatase (MazG superfamily)